MKNRWLPALVLSPSLLLVGVCVYGFIAFTFYLSFTASTILPNMTLAGGENYARLFSLSTFFSSLGNLGLFATLYIVISMALGMTLAILIDQRIRAESIFRSIFLYPMALSFIVTGTAWKWLLDPSIGLERTVHLMGFESFTFNWIKDGDMAIYTVVIAAVWQTSGFVMALFLAGLRGIDNEVLNAARVDGAKSWRIYTRIIIPQLGPSFISSFVILAHMAIKSYDLVIALTGGGPGRATWLPSVFMYQYTFTRNEMAVGAASAVIMLIGIAVVVVPYVRREMRLNQGPNA
ncbi:MAG: sugar ABC transporter permease [Burkholderiaceae bacterium]|jgi:glucose/mannose transport system permease protein|nr:sugar ABC transporter permease [Betaproteobacteria bacterium]MDA8599652.1 sugar ABC transporter permease [Burkholderiaceae bacterium]MDA9218773.1 sugar ABC transporter permease [Burkholderiaceae bacterium]MDG1107205.1 sugar ABC transporter permease [Burkholderiaceae bacterium]MDO7579272.1 sugar ABC transporter permease [Burkholderiaceae bacterium]|tara:strand:- start:1771 stop:2643 length:873 start_codon:yes stop_codon:yes gene_type:complete